MTWSSHESQETGGFPRRRLLAKKSGIDRTKNSIFKLGGKSLWRDPKKIAVVILVIAAVSAGIFALPSVLPRP